MVSTRNVIRLFGKDFNLLSFSELIWEERQALTQALEQLQLFFFSKEDLDNIDPDQALRRVITIILPGLKNRPEFLEALRLSQFISILEVWVNEELELASKFWFHIPTKE